MPAPLRATNPKVTSLRRLSGRRRARLEAGAFVVEGPVALAEALAAGAPVREVYVDVDAALAGDTAVARVLGAAADAGVAVHQLASGVLDKVTDTVTPQGVVAVAERRTSAVTDLAHRSGPVLVLAGVADPGNAGTLLRAGEAAGAAGALFCDDAVDPFGPKTVRAAAGSAFRLPVAEVSAGEDTIAALRELQAAGRALVATVARDGRRPEATELTTPFALLLGSEAHGLGADVAALVDTAVTIPMEGAVESLNVGVAGAVLLFEAARQRRSAS